jgi:hypothetical protein
MKSSSTTSTSRNDGSQVLPSRSSLIRTNPTVDPSVEMIPNLNALFAPSSLKILIYQQSPIKCKRLDRFVQVCYRSLDSAWLYLINHEENYETNEATRMIEGEEEGNSEEVCYILDIATDIRKIKEDYDEETGQYISIMYNYQRFNEFFQFEVIPIELPNGLTNILAFDFLLGQFCLRESVSYNHNSSSVHDEPTTSTQDRSSNVVATSFENTGFYIRKALHSSGKGVGHTIRFFGKHYTHAVKPSSSSVSIDNQEGEEKALEEERTTEEEKEEKKGKEGKEGKEEKEGKDSKDERKEGQSSLAIVERRRNDDTPSSPSVGLDPSVIESAQRRKELLSGFHSGARTATSTLLYPVRWVGAQASRHVASDQQKAVIPRPLRTGSTNSSEDDGLSLKRFTWDLLGGIGNGAVSICKGFTDAINEIGNAISDTAIYHATELHGKEYADHITRKKLEGYEDLSWASYKLFNVIAFGWQGLLIDAMIEGSLYSVALYDFLVGPVLCMEYMSVLHVPHTSPSIFFVVLRPWSIAFYQSANDFIKKPYKVIATGMLDTHPKRRIIPGCYAEEILPSSSSSSASSSSSPSSTSVFIPSSLSHPVNAVVELCEDDVVPRRLTQQNRSNNTTAAAAVVSHQSSGSDEELSYLIDGHATRDTALSIDDEGNNDTALEDEKIRNKPVRNERKLANLVNNEEESEEEGNTEEDDEVELMESEGVPYVVRHDNSHSKAKAQSKKPSSSSSSRPAVEAVPIEYMELGGINGEGDEEDTDRNSFLKKKADSSYLSSGLGSLNRIFLNWNGGNISHIEICTVDCSTYLLYPPLSSFNEWFYEIQQSCSRVETIAKRKSGAEELAMKRRLIKLPKKYGLEIRIKRFIQYLPKSNTALKNGIIVEDNDDDEENPMDMNDEKEDMKGVGGEKSEEEEGKDGGYYSSTNEKDDDNKITRDEREDDEILEMNHSYFMIDSSSSTATHSSGVQEQSQLKHDDRSSSTALIGGRKEELLDGKGSNESTGHQYESLIRSSSPGQRTERKDQESYSSSYPQMTMDVDDITVDLFYLTKEDGKESENNKKKKDGSKAKKSSLSTFRDSILSTTNAITSNSIQIKMIPVTYNGKAVVFVLFLFFCLLFSSFLSTFCFLLSAFCFLLSFLSW